MLHCVIVTFTLTGTHNHAISISTCTAHCINYNYFVRNKSCQFEHGTDLFQLNGNNYLVLKRQFTCHGIPDELMADNGPRFESREYLIFAQEYYFHSQIISLLHPGKWESGVSGQNCREHPEEISKRVSSSGSPSVQKHASTRLQLLARLASHVKKTQRNHPYSWPPTHPSGSVLKSGVWKHCRKRTKINGLVQQEGLAAPWESFQRGKKRSWNPALQISINIYNDMDSNNCPIFNFHLSKEERCCTIYVIVTFALAQHARLYN